MEGSLKKSVIKGTLWAMLERFSTQFIGFFITMILARLLSPDDYGTVALMSIFLAVSSVFTTAGFGTALIQKKNATELDFNSVFYFMLVSSLVVYAILFFIAPFVADFYKVPELTNLMRVLALTIVFNNISSIQNAELSRKLLFNLSFRISIIATMVTLVVGVPLAYCGFGPWALVYSMVLNSFVGIFTRWYYIAWRPKLMFSFAALRELFCFGWKMAVSVFLDAVYNNLYGLLIGKLYSKADLAYVNKGRGFPSLAMETINATLGRVAFPTLAQLQDDPARVRDVMRQMIRCSTYLVFPMMAGLAVCASQIVVLLFGDQWIGAVPYVQISCVMFAFWPFHTINLQGISAMGRSDIFLVLEIVKKVVGLTLLIGTARLGVFAFVCVMAFTSGPLAVLINCWPNRRLLGYGVWMQIRDVSGSALASFVMFGVCWMVGCLRLPSVAQLVVQIVAGMATYLMVSIVFRLTPCKEYANILLPLMARRGPFCARTGERLGRYLRG